MIKKIFFIIAIQSLILSTAYSEETPFFNGDTLIIPVIDTLKKSGEFQDVMFKFNDQGEWLLSDYKIGKEIGQEGNFEVIKNVEIIKTETFPIQIFLRVSGVFPSGCESFGRIKHKLIENNFNVAIYYDIDERHSTGEMACTQALVPFTRIIPLPVYGLQKGAYRYTVNGDFTGVFDLSSDNEL